MTDILDTPIAIPDPAEVKPDPEKDFTVKLRVEVDGFGRKKHRKELAYQVAKALCIALGEERVQVYYKDEPVLFDKVVDDGNEPPGYKPRWEQ